MLKQVSVNLVKILSFFGSRGMLFSEMPVPCTSISCSAGMSWIKSKGPAEDELADSSDRPWLLWVESVLLLTWPLLTVRPEASRREDRLEPPTESAMPRRLNNEEVVREETKIPELVVLVGVLYPEPEPEPELELGGVGAGSGTGAGAGPGTASVPPLTDTPTHATEPTL